MQGEFHGDGAVRYGFDGWGGRDCETETRRAGAAVGSAPGNGRSEEWCWGGHFEGVVEFGNLQRERVSSLPHLFGEDVVLEGVDVLVVGYMMDRDDL